MWIDQQYAITSKKEQEILKVDVKIKALHIYGRILDLIVSALIFVMLLTLLGALAGLVFDFFQLQICLEMQLLRRKKVRVVEMNSPSRVAAIGQTNSPGCFFNLLHDCVCGHFIPFFIEILAKELGHNLPDHQSFYPQMLYNKMEDLHQNIPTLHQHIIATQLVSSASTLYSLEYIICFNKP